MRISWSSFLLSVLGLLVALSCPAAAADPERLQDSAILLRALGYDRSLKDDAQADLPMLLLYRERNSGSERNKRDVLEALEETAAAITVHGRTVRVQAQAWSSTSTLDLELERSGARLLFICEGLDAQLALILGTTQPRGVRSLSASEAAVEANVALAVARIDGKPRIVVNLPAAEAEGAAFSSELLALAKVIR